MKVLIADTFEQSGIDGLKALGCDVQYEPALKDEALAARIAQVAATVLVVRSTKVTGAMLAPSLKLIVRAGSGVNTIDVKAATARGVLVANCPGKNAIAVAELAFALILALDRRIAENVVELRAGHWNKKEFAHARGLYGSTLGLLGAGSIAAEMIKRAAGFGLKVVLWSRRCNGEDRPLSAAEAKQMGLEDALRTTSVHVAPSPADVAGRSDILSLHLALVPETRILVNADVLARLKPGSIVINTSRAQIVDNDALLAAIHERQLRVGLDVFVGEPTGSSGLIDDPMMHEPGVYGTHHIGASTDQAQEAIAAETVRIVKAFKDTGRAPNAVNG